MTNIRRKKSTLFLSNWIKSGIIYIKDLNFLNGKLDEKYIYNTVNLKNNILIEISQVKLALNPYKDIMLSIPNNARPINNEADERFLNGSLRISMNAKLIKYLSLQIMYP